MTTADIQQILNEMHQMELRLSGQVAKLEVKVDHDKDRHDSQEKRLESLEVRYNRMLMLVITLLGAGFINLFIQIVRGA